MSNIDYKSKYLKYKNKYDNLNRTNIQSGGAERGTGGAGRERGTPAANSVFEMLQSARAAAQRKMLNLVVSMREILAEELEDNMINLYVNKNKIWVTKRGMN